MDAPATAIGPGTVIAGTYRIERALGEGGMGLVFEARHLRISRKVAIKVLREAPDREQLARFRQEAEIASRLGHPNIIEVVDFNSLPSGMAYLVMELLEGESLAARARRGPMPHTEALPILRQIASALFAAHGAGVIHRDLKPENVFLVPRERDGVITDHVKILDFGISKVQGSSVVRTSDDVVLGTPRYMAPEQAIGGQEIDARVDQFALAVIAFELLAGRAPFEGGNGTQVMFNIVYSEPSALAPLAPTAPPDLVAAIERALSKRPQDRFEDMSELAHAWTGKPFANAPDRPRDERMNVETIGTPHRRRAAHEPSTVAESPRGRASASPPIADEAPTAPTANESPRARAAAPPPIAAAAASEPATVQDSPRARIEGRSGAPTAGHDGAVPASNLPTSRGGRRWFPIAVVASATAVAAIIAVVTLARRDPAVEPAHDAAPIATKGSPVARDAPTQATGVDAAIADSASGIADSASATALVDAGPPDAAAAATTTTSKNLGATKPVPDRPSPKHTARSPESEAALAEAERLLHAGQLGEAKVAAERALRIDPHPRAHLVLAETACRRNDLAGAYAAMRALTKTGRNLARQRCAAAGFPVEEP